MLKYVALGLLVLVLVPVAGHSQETDEEYNRLVDEILEVTGALKIGEQLSALLVTQMTAALKNADSSLPDRAYELIEEEVNAGLTQSIESGSFSKLMYPVYARHLSKHDLQAMVAFYNTEEGARIAAATPIMAQQAMVAGQEWGNALGPEISNRVVKRLREEGIFTE